jgi:hypothetical protein
MIITRKWFKLILFERDYHHPIIYEKRDASTFRGCTVFQFQR